MAPKLHILSILKVSGHKKNAVSTCSTDLGFGIFQDLGCWLEEVAWWQIPDNVTQDTVGRLFKSWNRRETVRIRSNGVIPKCVAQAEGSPMKGPSRVPDA